MVEFPSRNKEEWKEWITTMPKCLKFLINRMEISICRKHFAPGCIRKKYVEETFPMNHQFLKMYMLEVKKYQQVSDIHI